MAAEYARGFAISLGLIVAIGAQNAFLLARAVRGERVALVAAICIVCDGSLIVLSVAGMGAALATHPPLAAAAAWGGAGFLLVYGARALRSALRSSHTLAVTSVRRVASTRATVFATLAVTLLNPHTYLDTFVLIGGISAPLLGNDRWLFGAGAVSASVTWFVSLAVAGRAMAPWFGKPTTWRLLDLGVALTMWTVAAILIVGRL